MQSGVVWRFDSFELDSHREKLSRDGDEIQIAAKPLALLVHLVRRGGAVVGKRELLEAIWPGLSVSDAAFQSVVRDLRRALGDMAGEPRVVATVRGKGLRLVPEVERVERPADARLAAVRAPGPWHEAALHLERALGVVDLVQQSRGQRGLERPATASRERAELLVLLARTRWSLGSTAEARAAFREASDAARLVGDPEILARAALGYAGRTDVTPGVNRQAVALLEEALEALGDTRPGLRAEVLARLGTELYHDPDSARGEALTQVALETAERTGDPGVLAYVLTACHFVRERPDVEPRERMHLADRAIDLVGEGTASDVLALALNERVLDTLELGDGPGFQRTLARFATAVGDLDQAFFSWLLGLFQGTRTLLAGDVDEAERQASEALALGTRIGSPNALSAFAGQLFAIRDHQGRLAELRDVLREHAQAPSPLPIFRAALAAAESAAGDGTAASDALSEVFCRDLEDFPRDQSWLGVLALVAPAVARSGHTGRTRRLLALFGPYTGRTIVVGYGVAVFGAVSHHLGMLHAALGERGAAVRLLEDAVREHRVLGSLLWTDRSLEALVRIR
jgi:DNA-binding winged helix-turn-helix (wHTH) protein